MHRRASMSPVGGMGAMIGYMALTAAMSAGLADTAQQLPVDAPNARQIMPIVAPYHRSAGPKQSGSPAAAKPPTTAAPVSATPTGVPAAPVNTPAAPPPAGVAANPAQHGALAPNTVVVVTCKAGQRYSAARKICFTPGVTAVASRTGPGPYVGSVNRVRAARAADPVTAPSALGVTQK